MLPQHPSQFHFMEPLLFQNMSSQTTPRLHRLSMIKECTAEDLTSSCCCCVHDMGNWGPV